jgi:hypothetical protein
MEVYGPEFTKETKSEETVAFTSDYLYYYRQIESLYSKATRQQSENLPEGAPEGDASIAKENESNGREMSDAYSNL